MKKNASTPQKVETLVFGNELHEYKLMELPDHILEDIEKTPNFRVTIKGSDSVSLCTDNETYTVQKVHCSNTILIKEKKSEIIDGFVDCYFETLKKPTGIIEDEVYQILKNNYHEGRPEKSSRSQIKSLNSNVKVKIRRGKDYTLTALRKTVYGSEGEIFKGLYEIGAFQTRDGFWKLLAPNVESYILNIICLTFQENQWKLNEINVPEIRKNLTEYDKVSVTHCVNALRIDRNEDELFEEEDELEYVKFDIEKIAKFQARLLFEKRKVWDAEDFLKSWEREVKNCDKTYNPDVKILYSICYFTDEKRRKLAYLDRRNLPLNLEERIKFLFQIRKRWTSEEIKPYLKAFETGKLKVEKILSSNVNSTKGITTKIKYYFM